jgi:L-iditol 2-dehydrogenase
MAEWVRVPGENVRGDTFAVNDLSAEQAVFIEPLGCTVKAYRRLAACLHLEGARGAVVGCGVMGLLNVQAGRAFGAAAVLAVEPDAERRRVALSCGAESALTPEEARDGLGGRMDFVVIGPGQPEVIRQALAYVRPGGSACLFTPTPAGLGTPLDLGDLYFREVNLLPSYSCGPTDTRRAYELLRTGRVRVEGLVTHRFGLDDVQRGYDTARAGGAALKVLITFPPPEGA